MTKKISVSGTTLKSIMMLFMLINHSGWTFFDLTTMMNPLSSNLIADFCLFVGKPVLPIFAFFIAEGYRHTHDRKKYLKRVGLLGLVSIIPFELLFFPIFGFLPQTTIFSLFFGLCALYFSDAVENKFGKILILVLFYFLSIPFDGGIDGLVLAIYAFHHIKNQKLRIAVGVILTNIFSIILLPFQFDSALLFDLLAVCLAIPLLYLYNGERGKDKKSMFYAFYPAHLTVLGLIHIFL